MIEACISSAYEYRYHILAVPYPPLEIIEISGRTEEGNGVSRPFLCQAANDSVYYVKLKNAGYRQLVIEWICGRLAQEMGLPIAPFRLVGIAKQLIAGNQELERELGHGVAFGSRKLSKFTELRLHLIPESAKGDCERMLLFDRWILNEDRKLSAIGGNPNCLLDLEQEKVTLIDHDNAFDETFSVRDFWSQHVFKNYTRLFSDTAREEARQWLEDGIAKFSQIWDELPPEWLTDEQGDPRPGIDRAFFETVLGSFRDLAGELWKVPTP